MLLAKANIRVSRLLQYDSGALGPDLQVLLQGRVRDKGRIRIERELRIRVFELGTQVGVNHADHAVVKQSSRVRWRADSADRPVSLNVPVAPRTSPLGPGEVILDLRIVLKAKNVSPVAAQNDKVTHTQRTSTPRS